MGKHSIDNKNQNNNTYGRIITRQGNKIITLEHLKKEVEEMLIQERMDRIEDLKNIKYIAQSNAYNNEKISLRKIAEIAGDKLEEITNGIIQNKKEPISNTDQSIKN